MARPGDVWRNKWKNDAWYATVRGKKVRVAEPHQTKEEALSRWHQLMAVEKAADQQEANPVKTIFELYLQMAGRERMACLPNRKLHLRSFDRKWPGLVVADLEPAHVAAWLGDHPEWAENTRHNYVSSILAALNWAAKPEQKYIPENPLKGMSQPQIVSRGAEALIPADVAKRLWEAAPAPLQYVLFALEQTGARPGTIRVIRAADCHWDQKLIQVDKHKTKKKTGKPLLLAMTDDLRDVLKLLAARHPEGPLFRTETGKAWREWWIINAFRELCERINLSPRPTLYHYRHTFATNLLLRGMSAAKVAALLGHKGTAMVEMHYGHLDGKMAELAEELHGTINPCKDRKPDAG